MPSAPSANRIAHLTEPETDSLLPVRVMRVTGGDTLYARALYGQGRPMPPPTDRAIRRRLVYVHLSKGK